MAKRKNPLKDLDAFLKQEASSIVKPELQPKEEMLAIEPIQEMVSSNDIINAINTLAKKDQSTYRNELYQIIQASIENLDVTQSEDKMLINTVLYLKDKNNWKNNIKQYWAEKL